MFPLVEHKVFGLEGMDGSGKTTIGKMVAADTGGTYIYCMDGNPLKPFRKLFDQQKPEMRFLYYIAVPLLNFGKIEKLRQHSDVFLDRTVASTIAYHRAYGVPKTWMRLVPSHLFQQIDHMLYFTVSEPERQKRLFERQTRGSQLTQSDLKSLELNRQIDAEYRKVFPNKTIIINTDFKDPRQTANEVAERIYGHKKPN